MTEQRSRPSVARAVFAALYEPPADYDVLHSGFAPGKPLPRPKIRPKPLLPAAPISIKVIGGTKKLFQLRITLHARNDATRTVSFEIARTLKDVRALQSEVLEACRQHPSTLATGLEPCSLCEPLKILPPLPEKTERLFSHVDKIHETISDRLSLFIAGALVSPNNTEYYCEGHVSVPVAVRNFLLRGVDDIVALK